MQTSDNILLSADVDRTTHTHTSRSGRLRCALRRMLVSATLLFALSIPGMAQNYYIIRNSTAGVGYLRNNNGSLGLSDTFSPSCVWIASGALGTTDRTLRSYVTPQNYLIGANARGSDGTTVTFGNTESNVWQLYNNYLCTNYNDGSRYFYLCANNNAFTLVRNNKQSYNPRFNVYTVDIRPHDEVNTIAVNISISGTEGNKINFTHSALSGSYTPEYTTYRINNNVDHNWYNDTDNGTTIPTTTNANTLNPTYTWSLTANGGGKATINASTGVLTLSGVPTGDITVRLTISNISPLDDKTVDFTLTRAAVAEYVQTTAELTNPTITPTSKALDYGDSQTFTAAATATATTTTVPAHTTLTGGGNTYFYYDNALHNAAPTGTSTETHPDPNYSWSLTGAAATGGYLTPTSGSGATINISYANASANQATATLTVTASTQGATNKTATATITANRTLPTGISASPTPIEVEKGSTGQFTYTLTPAGAYDEVTATSASTGIATVSKTGNTITVTGVAKGSTTITLSAARPGSTALTTTVQVTVKEACVTPTITMNPTTAGSTANVTLATTTDGATIYYTTDGSDPTTSSTRYTGEFEISNGGTVKAIAVKADYLNSPIASATYTADKIATPTISITASGVTFDCATTGVTYRYTTDGSTPTTSSTQWNGTTPITGLTDGTTIKVIATKQGMIPSDAATTIYYPASNVSDGTVTINDYEDHTWTYYSGVDESVDGGNYNSSYLGKLYSPNPRNVKITYNGVNGISGSSTTVKVSVDESQTSFVYYKTLEQGTTTGEYPYQVISNPFSVRPSTGTSNKVYYGFAGWKIVSGGEYIKNHNNNDVLSLDEEIVFNNLPYSSVNCTSAEIVFETTWKTANRTYVSSNPGSNQTYNTSGDYETNFYVINCGYTRTITTSEPVTIMMVEPDGSADYRNNTFSGNITPNNDGVTKIEWARWTTTGDINATGRSFTIGRGIVRPSGGSTLYGSNTNRAVDQIFKIESGIWTNCYALGSNAPSNNMTKQFIVFGNDYDRAKGTNTNLILTNTFRLMDGNKTIGNNKEIITVKSGQLTRDLDHSTAQASGNCFYLWNNSANTTGGTGTRELIIEGGEMWHIAGGVDEDNYANDVNLRIRVKGGTIHGCIYGGAARYDTRGYKQFIFTGGTVEGWIAGGSNGYLAAGNYGSGYEHGTVTGRSYVYVGGNTHVGGKEDAINMSIGGYVFGAGCGNTNANTNAGSVTDQTNVVIADNAYIKHGVYGGGAYGSSLGTANVYVLGQAVIDGDKDNNQNVIGGVFGGARQKGGGSVNITMNGGNINKGGLFGGSNATGTISGSVVMQINGGQVGTNSNNTVNIHGGGYGQPTRVSQNVDITLGATGQTTPGVTVYGDVYGGSALGYVNGTAATTTNHTYVTMNKGTINGSLYGGGLGDGSNAANVYGPVQVEVNGGKATNVYGCNNLNGSPQGTVSVTINGTDQVETGNAIDNVFGGGNQAAYNGTPDVDMKGGIVGNIFGGGNEAGVSGGDVSMTGGNVKEGIYGGCNTSGTVSGAVSVSITGGKVGVDATHTANVHGGGYGSATATNNNVTVAINGSTVDIWGDVYGGSALGNVNSSTSNSTTVTLTDGTIHGCIYGGGLGDNSNPALVNGNVTVTVDGGKVLTTTVESRTTGAVFGCNNVNGTPKGTVDVIINGTAASEGTGDSKVYALQGVYGGGNQAHYDPTNTSETYPRVTINGCETSIKDVYGGGNAAAVPNTNVIINGGDIKRVFAGGNGESNVPANIGYKNKLEPTTANSYGSGKAVASINGGTIVQVFGGSNAHGVVRAGGKVTIDNAGNCEMHITDVFGGGNEAAGAAGEIEIKCTGGTTEGITNVYGGANKADVSSDITLNITGGRINNVFGGNNERGNVAGKITVNIEVDGTCSNNSINNVYGGGNLASYTPTTAGAYPEVNIKNGTISGNVFGGGLGATAKVYSNPKVTIGDVSEGHSSYVATVTGNVYGGGSAAMVGDDEQATASINNTTVLIQKSNTSVGKVFGGGAQAGVTGTTTITIADGSVSSGVYGGCDESGTVGGKITVSLTNGTIGASGNRADVFGGGLGSATATSGDIEVALNGTTIYGDLYGGSAFGSVNAADADPANTTTLTISSNTLHGTIYGGGKGSNEGDSITATTNGNVLINYNITNDNLTGLYGGANINGLVVGDIEVSVYANVGASGDGNSIDIFGGGLGAATGTNGNVTVTIDKAEGQGAVAPVIYGDIYGGSSLGEVGAEGKTAKVDFKNGTLNGNIYGGGMGQLADNTTNPATSAIAAAVSGGTEVAISGGSITDGVYGGCNANGNVVGDIAVNLTGGTIGAQNGTTNIVFGGGYGSSTSTNGNVTVNVSGTTVHGNVYGGSALGNVNDAVTDETKVNLTGGTINGSVYGGGLGNSTTAAYVNGSVTVTLDGSKVTGNIFGCNNLNGTPLGHVKVWVKQTKDNQKDDNTPRDSRTTYDVQAVYGGGDKADYVPTSDDEYAEVVIDGCDETSIGYVYGGGNAAAVPATEVTINGTYIIDYVFGGGNGAGEHNPGAHVGYYKDNNDNIVSYGTGTAVTKLYGGKIHYVYGGSNTLGNIRQGATVSMPGTNSCTLDIKEIYGAGQVADMQGSVNMIIGCVTGIDAIYGGAKNANIEGGVTLTITSGTLRQVFGGNNVAGTIQGPIQVNIEETACDPINISELYLGGNQAPYSVYGYKEVTENQETKLEPRSSMSDGTAIGSATAYSESQLYADPVLNVISCTSIGRVFGGGLGASAVMYGNPTVNVNMIPGDHATSIDRDENNTADNNANHLGMVGDVYGGGSEADVYGNTTVNIGTGSTVTMITKDGTQNVQGAYLNGDIYGGGLAASVFGDTKVNIGTVTYSATGYEGVNITGSIFGGGEGQTTLVTGDVEVKIGESAAGNATITGDIYGGSALGNVNAYDNNGTITYSTGKTTSVTLNKGTVNGSIYGGGLGQLNGYYEATSDIISNVYGPVTVTVNSGKATNVFGCNNLNGSPKSTVEVLIEGSDASVVNNNTTTYAIGAVYGGGNMAHYDPTTVSAGYPSVTVNGCSTSIEDVYGGGNAAAVPETNVTINGGDIKRVFAGGNGESGTPANVGYKNKTEDLTDLTDAQLQEITYGAGTALATINGGTIVQVFGGSNAHGLLREGSEVDIEKNGSCEMHITDVFGGGNKAAGAAGEINIKCTGGETEGITNVFGGANKARVTSDITLNITGGRIENVFGGNNETGNVDGKITVNIEEDGSCLNINNVYGGGNLASYTPTTAGAYPEVNIKNGTISGNVFGGGLGATAKVYSNPVVTIGDVSEGHSSYVATVTGNVYGGGSAAMVGDDVAATASINNTTVLIQKSNTSVGKVFGGGAQAGVTGTTTVTIADGSVSAGVYGGCDESGTVSGNIAVYVNGGTVGTDATHTANVHGGGLGNSTATGADVTVIIGNSTTTPTIWGDVYGGSGYGNVNASSTDLTKVWLKKGTVNGNVYGGGLGQKANGDNPAYSALVNGAVEVVVDGGTVTGSVFGCNNANGAPQSTVTVDINATDPVSGEGYALSKVFGGGNEADYNGIPHVTIHGCDNTIEYVYGGGNLATVKGTVVTVYGGTIGNVFGGGYGASVTNDGTDVNIYGGTIGYVFGGNNQSGTVTGQISVDVDKQTETDHSPCEMHIGEVYGGGNLAASQAGTVTIGCTGTATEGIQYVYGGAKDAQVTGDINLTITGGRITEAVFGGNNVGHTVEGDITVNIEWDGSCDQNYVKDVFGGGNMAPYYNAGSYPAVNIKNGTVSGSVYGGGKGADAVVTANPVVTIGDITEGHESYVATVSGNVFGGGDAAAVDDNEQLSYTSTNNTTVLIQKSNTSVTGKVFGGGNEAGVKGNAVVTLASGSVAGGVYGGCNTTGTIGGTTQVNVTGGTVGANAANAHANVHGGGYGQGTAVSGNVTVNIGTNGASTGANIYGDVYGGSAMGTVNTAYNATTHTTYETTTVNLYSGTIDGNVYGGGLGTENIAAYVYGNAEVYQYGAILISRTETDPGNASLQIPVSGMIFGCNNVNGTPKGHVKVVVYKTTGITGNDTQTRSTEAKKATSEESDHTYELLAVFGGGNQAEYVPDSDSEFTEVIIDGCDEVSIHTVYGGGNAASTPATKVEVIGTYEIEYVFGGGNGAGSTNPGANVGYHYYDHDGVLGGTEQEDIDRRLQTAGLAYGTGKASTNIYGGRIHKVFGGSNTKGNVRQASVAMVDEVSSCEMILDGFYGGGKSAYMEGKGDIHLGCVSGLTEIYGGAERADVGSDVVLTLTSGHYDKVYGGNNLSGNIHGSITINIEQTGCKPITIGELFGGGNNAAYSVYGYDSNGTIIPGGTQIYDDPVINIRSCQSIDAIYGGGEGENATLYGNPHINVNIVKGWIDGRDDSNNTPADINVDGVIGTIYGGGKKADVNGDTYIFIADQSTVEMQSLKDLKAKINSATSSSTTEHIEMQVTGSGDNEAITYTISGNASPTLTKTIKQTVNGATITGNVYGGGREADITGSSHITIGPDGEEQQSQSNPAPIRSAQPAQQTEEQPTQNAATESQQTRSITPTRL